MTTTRPSSSSNEGVVTGAGSVLLKNDGSEDTCDPLPFLKVRKSRKFMGVQDDLAVVATGRALASAGLSAPLGERAGLYLAVGYIPFREDDIKPVLEASVVDDRFDVQRFGAGGFQRAHPLLTFRCLPNMPAYHVSVCFGIEGPYAVTYPGPAQLYAALEEARAALSEGRIDIAIVGAVAHQSNFLVRHHFARLDPPIPSNHLRDVAGVIVLEREAHARERGRSIRARIESLTVEYDGFDILDEGRASIEAVSRGSDITSSSDIQLGPALLPHAISEAIAEAIATLGEARNNTVLTHRLESRDGVRATSTWVLG